GKPVVVDASDATGASWVWLTLTHPDEHPITQIRLRTGAKAAEYLVESIEGVSTYGEPECNAEWVADFLREVKAVYTFEILSGVDHDDGWSYVYTLMDELIEGYDSILYAEAEGYSHGGLQLTWEFSDGVRGEKWVALYDARTDSFRQFPVELSDPAH